MIPIAQTIQNKKINAGIIPILGLEILQNHSNKNSMSLAQIQACKQIEWNRGPRIIYIQAIAF
jgi:hypothetical protein